MLENGQRLVVHYPVSTHITAEPVFRRREFLVKGVRDLVRDPLTVQEYCNRTLVRRSRWLVHARDVQLGEWRRFYLGTTQEYWRSTPLRLGLFHPETNRFEELLGRPFEATASDRILLARTALEWSGRDFDGLKLGVFADDFDLINFDS
jgi:hypothetical protein